MMDQLIWQVEATFQRSQTSRIHRTKLKVWLLTFFILVKCTTFRQNRGLRAFFFYLYVSYFPQKVLFGLPYYFLKPKIQTLRMIIPLVIGGKCTIFLLNWGLMVYFDIHASNFGEKI